MKLEKVLNKAEDINSSLYCISIYTSSKNNTKLELRKKLKSQILQSIKDFSVENTSSMRTELVENISSEIDTLEDIPTGTALFTKFDLENNDQTSNYHFIPLYKEPVDDVYIGKIYKIDQLYRSISMKNEAIVLNISKENCDVYELTKNELKHLTTLNNQYYTDRENEYQQKYSPTRNSSVIHGTGSKNYERSQGKSAESFLSDIYENIRKYLNQQKYKNIVIYYSQTYSNLTDSLIDEIKTSYPNLEISKVDKNLQDKNKLFEHAKGLINSLSIAESQNELLSSREQHDLHVSGWNSVTDASRMQKIDTLFIGPDSQKFGYIKDGRFAYSYPVKDSKKVENITPWLVDQTLKNGGKVVYIKDTDLLPQNSIEAKLRY